MAPKKTKAKKEEVVEIPKPHSLPDGPKTHYIGGWSTNQSLTSLEATLKADTAANNIYVLPGLLDESQHVAEGSEETVVILPASVALNGLLPAQLEALKADTKAPAEGAEGEGEAEAAAAEGEGEEEETANKKPTEKVLFADRAITIKGFLRLQGIPPPEPVTPPPVAEAAPEEGQKKPTKGKKAAVKEDPAEVAAREAALAAAREKAQREKEEREKGACPSKWPTIELSNMFFEGSVVVKGAHMNFTNCHFAGAKDNQLSVHQYCKVNLSGCSFAAPTKAGVYLYPKSEASMKNCIFAGRALPQNAEEHEAMSSPTTYNVGAMQASSSVGLHADDTKVTVTDCVFEGLGHGILLNDKCADSTLEQCVVRHCGVVGILCHGTAATIKESKISSCGYYGLRFEGKCRGKVLRNVVDAQVKIGEGAQPFLHTNTLSSKLFDLNEKGTVSLEPKY